MRLGKEGALYDKPVTFLHNNAQIGRKNMSSDEFVDSEDEAPSGLAPREARLLIEPQALSTTDST